MKIATIEPGNRVQLPAQWIEELGFHGKVVLEKTSEGILIRPAPQVTWDEIFKKKLPIGQIPTESDVHTTKDDFLF